MKFYTSFFRAGNKLCVRGYDGNSQFFEKHNLTPSLYIKDNTNSQLNYTSFFGDKLKKIDFDNAWDARNFIKDNKDMEIFGYPFYEYTKIAEMFDEEHDTSKLVTAYIDIETYVGDDQDGNPEVYDSFPNIMDAQHAISLITTLIGKNVYVYGLSHNWNPEKILDIVKNNLPPNFDYDSLKFDFVEFSDDKSLLQSFIRLMETNLPDIITGWNSNGFDIPYICNRMENVLGPDSIKRLSPFNMTEGKLVNQKFGKKGMEYNISGVEQLDYLELYKKFELSPRENYKLETITQLELGAGKLDYSGSFQNFYKTDWDKFTAYNIVDVLLVSELENKLGFIQIAAAMAYAALCVFTDVFRVTRIWDNIISNYCSSKGIHVPTEYQNMKQAYEGAYVKPTIPGKYPVLASFDVGSLYPNIIVENNISPEKILPENEFIYIKPEDIINKTDIYYTALDNAINLNATLSANGALFTKEGQGIIPQLVEIYIEKRKSAKNEMKKWGNKLEYAKKLLQEKE